MTPKSKKESCGRPSRRMREMLLCCYLSPNQPSIAEAIRHAKLMLPNETAASDFACRRWLSDYAKANPAIVVYAREGVQAYLDNTRAKTGRRRCGSTAREKCCLRIR